MIGGACGQQGHDDRCLAIHTFPAGAGAIGADKWFQSFAASAVAAYSNSASNGHVSLQAVLEDEEMPKRLACRFLEAANDLQYIGFIQAEKRNGKTSRYLRLITD